MPGNDLYYLRHPREQMFYKVIAVLSNFLGMGDQTWWDFNPPRPLLQKVYNIQFVVTHIAGPYLVIFQIIYFYVNHSTLPFETKGIIYVLCPVTIFTTMNLVSARLDRNIWVMKDFMRKYHLCNYINPDEEIKQIRIRTEIITRLSCYFTTFFLLSDWFSWSFLTVYNNYNNIEQIRNKTMMFQTILFLWYPFDYKYDFKNWVFVHTCNVYMVFFGCTVNLLHNGMNYAFVLQLIGHIKVLRHKLRTQFLGDLTYEEVKERLVDVIQYHSFVLSIFSDIQTAFGFIVTSNYLYNLLSDSVLLYHLMVGDKSNNMMFGMMLGAYLGGMIILSIVLEEIRRQTDDISNLVYNLPWESTSLSNRKIIYLLLLKIQRQMVFTSAGGLECGVKPMISILQSTFSYYVMLKSTNV